MTQADEAVRTEAADAPPVVHLRHPGWWIGSILILAALALLIHSFATNSQLGWSTVGNYLFNAEILSGLFRTVWLSAVAMGIALCVALPIAVMRLSGNPVFRWVSSFYVWFFRGVPPLVQLVFWYNLATVWPKLSLSVPFGGPTLLSVGTNSVISSYTAAILGLSLCEAAYSAEIIRAGLQSVERGQLDAAHVLGLTPGQTLRRIIVPQALRVAIPPLANEAIGMLKFTSLVSILAVPELLYSAQLIYSRNFETIPLLIVATIWYLVLATACTQIAKVLERRFSRGAGGGHLRRTARWSAPRPSFGGK